MTTILPELPAVFVGLHASMTNISLPQAELKLFLDQHHKVLKDASFFISSDDRGTLDLVQGLHACHGQDVLKHRAAAARH